MNKCIVDICKAHNKTQHKEIMSGRSLDYFLVSETKLDSSFPSAQFHINEYEVRVRRDRDKNGGGLIEFVRKGFICKRLKKIEPKSSEVIYSEFIISVCNFQSMKSPVELNSLFSKLFCYVTWFVISPD